MRYNKVEIKTYYNLAGSYLPFEYNPLHNTLYENVGVEIEYITKTIHGVDVDVEIVHIEGQEPIECELLTHYTNPDGTLIIKLCQDWG